VINRELHGDFVLDAFEHVAFFDREQEWIEMRLRALAPMVVNLRDLDLGVHFANREEMRTEISAKFTRERIERDLRAAGLRLHQLMTDSDGLFALSLSGP
jgi:L-histidine N-alpha-methyltransferase